MPAVILDACGLLNLYAGGKFMPILAALRHEWFIPVAVERESHKYRQPDPSDPEKLVVLPIDLRPAIDGGLLIRCDCESDEETESYVELATRIGDDGESMGLAIAKHRGWSVLTDDKKARKVAAELGVRLLSTAEVVKTWSEVAKISKTDLSDVLRAIERFANYWPGSGADHFDWWANSIREGCA